MTARFTPTPQPDRQRLAILAAFDALIEARLDATRHPHAHAADNLLRWLEHTGCATVTALSDRTMSLRLMGATVTLSDTSPAGILRAWQTHVRDQMAPGVRG